MARDPEAERFLAMGAEKRDAILHVADAIDRLTALLAERLPAPAPKDRTERRMDLTPMARKVLRDVLAKARPGSEALDAESARLVACWHAERIAQGGLRALRYCGPRAYDSIQDWASALGHPLKET